MQHEIDRQFVALERHGEEEAGLKDKAFDSTVHLCGLLPPWPKPAWADEDGWRDGCKVWTAKAWQLNEFTTRTHSWNANITLMSVHKEHVVWIGFIRIICSSVHTYLLFAWFSKCALKKVALLIDYSLWHCFSNTGDTDNWNTLTFKAYWHAVRLLLLGHLKIVQKHITAMPGKGSVSHYNKYCYNKLFSFLHYNKLYLH